ncbi:hypothetical protein FACS1894139_18810 [Planctomycetales bacterium]|nr:hypothetical protein FACS1894139_18810 [Planctomycetales bacterium]
MQIMLLMGSSRITINHEEYPLYLTEIDEKLILERQISYCKNLLPAKFLFCVNTGDIKFFHVDSIINQIAPDSEIIPVNGATKGAICTALLGATHINNDDELILLGVDDFVEDSGKEILTYFHKNHSDAGVVSFNSVHPRYSFARTDHNDNVTEVAEKSP